MLLVVAMDTSVSVARASVVERTISAVEVAGTVKMFGEILYYERDCGIGSCRVGVYRV